MGRKKKEPSIFDHIANTLSLGPISQPMNLPPNTTYRPGTRGGAWLKDTTTGKERYATDEEKKAYNLPKTGRFYKREVKKGSTK